MDTASTESEGDEKEDGDLDGVTVDTVFAAERDQIKSKRKECKLDLDRLDDENNKFTIQSAEKQTKCTLTDALFDKLEETQTADIEQDEVHRLKEYLVRNQFDSDGVVADLENVTESNIERLVQSSALFERMTAFIRSIKCMSSICVLISTLTLSNHSLYFQCAAKRFPPALSLIIGLRDSRCP